MLNALGADRPHSIPASATPGDVEPALLSPASVSDFTTVRSNPSSGLFDDLLVNEVLQDWQRSDAALESDLVGDLNTQSLLLRDTRPHLQGIDVWGYWRDILGPLSPLGRTETAECAQTPIASAE